jgi:acetyl esterase/lipase
MALLQFRRCLAAFLALALPIMLPAQTNAPAPDASPFVPAAIVELHDVVIGKGGDRDLHAEIAYPKDATSPLPAIIFIHGGGFSGGNYKQSPILQIAHAGYFAASIEYRLSGEAKFPAQLEDCKLGVRWLHANTAQYHVDPNRIGVWGESAGGLVVNWLETMGDAKQFEGDGGYPGVSSAVQAVVDYYGQADLRDPAKISAQSMKNLTALFGASLEQNPDLWKSGSPITYLKAGDPPILMVHGDSDTSVFPVQSIDFDAALTKVGVPHQLVIVKNAGHGFAAVAGKTIDPSRAEIQQITFAFLDKYLKAP